MASEVSGSFHCPAVPTPLPPTPSPPPRNRVPAMNNRYATTTTITSKWVSTMVVFLTLGSSCNNLIPNIQRNSNGDCFWLEVVTAFTVSINDVHRRRWMSISSSSSSSPSQNHNNRQSRRTLGIPTVTLLSASTITSTTTLPAANSTVPMTNYNDIRDNHKDVDDDDATSTTSSTGSPGITIASEDKTKIANDTLASLSSKDLDHIFSTQWNALQQQNDQMSAVEIIRTAMTLETVWKQQRYIQNHQQQNTIPVDQHSSENEEEKSRSTSNDEGDNDDIVTNFNIVLKAWCKTCQLLLEFHDQNTMVTTATTTLSSALSSSSSSPKRTKNNGSGASSLDYSKLQWNPNTIVLPSIYTAKDAATHVTEFFLEQLSSSHPQRRIPPHRNSFHIVMETWSKSHDPTAPEQVRQFIQLMKQQYQIPPDTVSYNLYIETIAHGKIGTTTSSSSSSTSSTNYNDRIDRINEVLQEMESCPTATSNAQTINSVLHAYSTTIGKYVSQLNYNQVDPHKKSMWQNEIETLLNRVWQIFHELKQSYVQTQNPYQQPDLTTYTTVMECLARHGTIQSTERVEALLREMKEIHQRNNGSSNSTANSNNSNNKRFYMKPSVYTYTTVIKAWSRTYHPNATIRADELLQECIDMYQSNENPRGYQYNSHQNKLTSVIFTSVIQCWSRSQEPTKAVRVLQILQQMRTMAKDAPLVNPTLLTYNTAMDACTKTRGTPAQQTAALKIAFAIFKTMEISNNIVPNHVTYGTLLKAISALVPLGDETRNTLSKAVFEKATQASQVDRNVIQQLQKSCDTAVLQSLLLSSTDPNRNMIQTNHNGHIDYEKVPSQWSKNVRTP